MIYCFTPCTYGFTKVSQAHDTVTALFRYHELDGKLYVYCSGILYTKHSLILDAVSETYLASMNIIR